MRFARSESDAHALIILKIIKKGWQTNALVEIQGIEAIFQLLQAVEFKVS